MAAHRLWVAQGGQSGQLGVGRLMKESSSGCFWGPDSVLAQPGGVRLQQQAADM